jgi:hypothetical protein
MTNQTSQQGNGMVLFTLKGQVTVHFTDGQTLTGEFAAQDTLNIFLRVDNEPLMIPRVQIRYIRGTAVQTIESDDYQGEVLGKPPEEITVKSLSAVREKTDPSIWDTDVGELEVATDYALASPEASPSSAFADDEDEDEATVFLNQQDEDSTVFLDQEEDEDEATVFFDEPYQDEATVFLEEDDDDDRPTFLLTPDKPEAQIPSFLDDDDDATVFFDDDEEEDRTVFVQEEKPAPLITAYLDCTAGPHAGQRFELQPGVMTIGRSSDNTIPLSSDKEVSRRHALITPQPDGHFLIEDRGSLNGVIINNIRIESPTILQDDDDLLIGQCVFTYHDE